MLVIQIFFKCLVVFEWNGRIGKLWFNSHEPLVYLIILVQQLLFLPSFFFFLFLFKFHEKVPFVNVSVAFMIEVYV